MRSVHLTLTLLGCSTLVAAFIPDRHFVDWFPAYRADFEKVVRNNCSAPVDRYLNGDWSHCPGGPHGGPTCPVTDVLNCILNNVSETRKTLLAAAAIVLGLLPTVLGLQGSTTGELGLLMLRRPLLAVILSMGAPAMYPVRTSESNNPLDVLRQRHQEVGNDPVLLPKLTASAASAVSALQYVLAAAAATNAVILMLQLGINCVCVFRMDFLYPHLIYALSAIAIIAVSGLCVHLRVRVMHVQAAPHGFTQVAGHDGSQPLLLSSKGLHRISSLPRWLAQEATPYMLQPQTRVRLQEKTVWFILVMWSLTTGVVVHVIWGTVVLASTIFISPADAFLVAVRFLASQLVCRAIVVFEVSGMRSTTTVVS